VLERLRNNWQLKLLALFFSVMLWLIVVGVEKAEITVKVPVEVFGQSPNLVVDGEVAPELDLRLYGPRTPSVPKILACPSMKPRREPGQRRG